MKTHRGTKFQKNPKPCKKCGAAHRYLDGSCVPCKKARSDRARAADPGMSNRHFFAWRAKDPRRPLLAAAKARAIQRGLPFDITLDDIVFPEDMLCPYLGITMLHNHGNGKGAKGTSPTLDCIIPALSYVKGNVIVCSHRANMLKNSGTWQEHIAIGTKLKELQSAAHACSNDQGTQDDQVPGVCLP